MTKKDKGGMGKCYIPAAPGFAATACLLLKAPTFEVPVWGDENVKSLKEVNFHEFKLETF